jgi:hypothetical protein
MDEMSVTEKEKRRLGKAERFGFLPDNWSHLVGLGRKSSHLAGYAIGNFFWVVRAALWLTDLVRAARSAAPAEALGGMVALSGCLAWVMTKSKEVNGKCEPTRNHASYSLTRSHLVGKVRIWLRDYFWLRLTEAQAARVNCAD